MNKIELNIKIISDADSVTIDGIEFVNAILVKLLIDGLPIEQYKFMDVVLVVFSELLRSLCGNGVYLIFTSASGVADDGGWEGVTVIFENNVVKWNFEAEGKKYHFEFEVDQYKNAIKELERKISSISDSFILEPSEVFFPENWDC